MSDSRPDPINPRPIARPFARGASRSKWGAGLLAGAAAAALFAGTIHSIRAESPQPTGAVTTAPQAAARAQAADFSDVVASVKPAVVSVRVKAHVAPQLIVE